MTNKIGVLTMYYNSNNYGGLLQAYALVEYLNENGFDAQQISYDYFKGIRNLYYASCSSRSKKVQLAKRMIRKFYRISTSAFFRKSNYKICVRDRNEACIEFRDSIPHTRIVYDENNIRESIHLFDTFVVGSDQVWNPASYRPIFFLDFVDSAYKGKISYAASISNELKGENVKTIYKEHLSDFDAISVREESSVASLRQLVDKDVEWVIDPVFLLGRDKWELMCQDRITNDRYIFCYFLGDDFLFRKIAEDFARLHKFKLVFIPYMRNTFRRCDYRYGDIVISNVSPTAFISLIKHSEMVFTDSFHASAFSIIFGKKFVSFNRAEHKEMGFRIKEVCRLCDCEDLFCDTIDRINLDYINNIYMSEHSYHTENLMSLIEKSKFFLLNNLRGSHNAKKKDSY